MDGGMSEMVVEVEVVRGDGLRDIGDSMDVGGGFYSMMSVLVWDWGSSLVRSMTLLEVALIIFLWIDGGLVASGRVFLIVGLVWEWEPTEGIEVMDGLQVKEVIGIELINS